ncbi:AfsR/SARP family transcriptional regulator [Paenibacillus turpanensis]|uniref:AfsR/SARP family transcriptional regulator n=1 Tax=Paenibacillus turpanensis TaxID=2689078 RepID=UPI00140820D4|nr:BTAD domain-containing putative transcriptional regulator [Paenibacillus turpanensis]
MLHQAERLIQRKQYMEGAFFLEKCIRNGQDIPHELMVQVPNQYVIVSPYLSRYWGQAALENGSVQSSIEFLTSALRMFASYSLHEDFLGVLALIAQANLRIGNIEEFVVQIQYLDQEYSRKEIVCSGVVPYTISLGEHYTELLQPCGVYLEEAFQLYLKENDPKGMSIVLVEANLRPRILRNPECWEENYTLVVNRLSFDSKQKYWIYPVTISYLYMKQNWTVLLEQDKDLEQEIQQIPYYYQCLVCALLRLAASASGIGQGSGCERLSQPVVYDDVGIQFLISVARVTQMKDSHEYVQRSIHLYQQCRLPSHKTLVDQHSATDGMVAESAAPGIQVFGFGSFQIHGPDGSYPIQWTRKRARDLFIYLLLQPKFSCTKEKAVEDFFPNHDYKKALNQINVTVHSINSSLGEHIKVKPIVIQENGLIYINPVLEIHFDINQYLLMLQSGEALWISNRDEAFTLYRQASELFQPIFTNIEGAEWIHRFQDELFLKQLEVFRRLGEYAVQTNRLEEAEAVYKQAVNYDPLQEEFYQGLIAVLISKGKSGEAMFWYKQLESLLRKELDMEPMEETRLLLQYM